VKNLIGIKTQKAPWHRRAWRSRYLLLMMAFPFVYLILFDYIPMYGAQIAFREFNPFRGIWGSEWVGFLHFKNFFQSVFFWRLFRNTLVISLTQLVFTFPLPIIVALMLNEVRNRYVKQGIQTVIYLPHFISVVVVVGLIFAVLSPHSGIVNRLIQWTGRSPVYFFNEPVYFPFILAFADVWQGTGWGTIVYLAAISAIDPTQYEAAVIDGANRFKQVIHITIPAIMPTIITLLILRIGGLFSVGFQRILLLYNPTIYETADIIQTFVYRRGILGQEYSYTTAVGLFNSVLNLVMLITFNKFMRKVSDTSLW
jgi:putative aldouronate transport system permease protein